MRFVVVALVLAFAGHAMAEPDAKPKSKALVILEGAISNERDPKELEKALAEADALIAKNAKDSDAHYVRGWVLSRLGKSQESVAAYDRAFELDPRLVDAAYNAGVVLGRTGDSKAAIVRFDRALKANPKHVDAAYNAGQASYDLGEVAKAAAYWETAMKLSPEDFQVAKKLVQAYVALGKADKVKRARDRVFAMWKSRKDPEVGNLKSYVYDQFTAGKYHVYVFETFAPSGDLAYIWQAKVVLKDKVLGSVNLETSAALRDKGVPFILRYDSGGEHTTLPEHNWKKLPDYATFKALVARTIDSKFN